MTDLPRFTGCPQDVELETLLARIETLWRRQCPTQFSAAPGDGVIPKDRAVRVLIGRYFAAGISVEELPRLVQRCREWLWLSTRNCALLSLEKFVAQIMTGDDS